MKHIVYCYKGGKNKNYYEFCNRIATFKKNYGVRGFMFPVDDPAFKLFFCFTACSLVSAVALDDTAVFYTDDEKPGRLFAEQMRKNVTVSSTEIFTLAPEDWNMFVLGYGDNSDKSPDECVSDLLGMGKIKRFYQSGRQL